MAYAFESNRSATFKVPPSENAKTPNLPGINATITSADVICDGVASLLSVASLTGEFELAERTVKESVIEDD